MTKAEALNCPNCGGGVQSDRPSCEFCKTLLKTAVCPSCFGMFFVGNRFCGHCGGITAPAEPVSERRGDCPRCRSPLNALKVADLDLLNCSECQGIWMSTQSFENACSVAEDRAALLAHLKGRGSSGLTPTKVKYVPCPVCGELMNRSNFARISGVVVDICRAHGVWLDADELPAIITFVINGGREKARQRELAELKDERSRLADERRRSSEFDRKFGTGGSQEQRERSGIGEFIRGLFE